MTGVAPDRSASGGPLPLDRAYLTDLLVDLLRTPSPSGRTDQAIQLVGDRLTDLGFEIVVTRRGALRVEWGAPREHHTRRALIAHIDTLGATVKELKENGRLAVVPIGTYSPRVAEGARVTLFTDGTDRAPLTGTILPVKAAGHRYHREVDTQPSAWDNLEVRVDERVDDADGLATLGLRVGDHIAVDSVPVVTPSGFVNARHLDDKAGVAAVLTALKALRDAEVEPTVACQVLITISEEVGHGASNGLDDDVAELVAVDNAVVAPGQQSREDRVTIATQDLHGPFDYHLTRHLIELCRVHGIRHCRDVFDFYRSDAAAALEAGMATRAALVGVPVDASHAWERTHLDGVAAVVQLLVAYLRSELTFTHWDRAPVGPLEEFPSTSVQPAPLQPPR